VQSRLQEILQRFSADTGTIHFMEGGVLVLEAHIGISPRMAEIVARVPVGKGMAGLAAQRNAPVSICNLVSDASGDARPGARDTGIGGALVVPIRDAGGAVIGTLGIGVRHERTYTEEETQRLLAEAAALGEAFSTPRAAP
jgi:putative methionine-R-sulfoxide reductase with GAF domain